MSGDLTPVTGHPHHGPAAVARLWRRRLVRFVKGLSIAVLTLIVLAGIGLALLIGWYWTRQETAPPAPTSGELALPRGLRSVTLYFAAPDGDSLVVVQRQVLDTDRVTESVTTLVGELVRGPGSGSARPVFPAGTALRHVFLGEAGNVYVDFSPELLRRFRGGSTAEYLMLTSLVRTLAVNLPTVSAVVITVNGEPVSSVGGHFDLEAPLPVSEWR